MMSFNRTLLLCLSIAGWSCATTMEDGNYPPVGELPSSVASPHSMQPDTIDATSFAPSVVPENRLICTLITKNGAISRTELNRQIDGGLGRWLQQVEGDRSIAKGRFQGWLIKSLHPKDPCYTQLPLRPGDIVTQVNGKRLEKPEQAFEVVEGLKTSTSLVVDYLRDGKSQTMRLEISSSP
jgi:S1-C subfamily serine protease